MWCAVGLPAEQGPLGVMPALWTTVYMDHGPDGGRGADQFWHMLTM